MIEKNLLNDIKEYLSIEFDYDKDDKLISTFILASKMYLDNAGVKVKDDNEEYRLVLKMLVSQMYESRVDGSNDKNPSYCLSLQSLITQLTHIGGSNEEN